MRIAMLSWESSHSVAVGGLAVHVTELAQSLTMLGHEVDVFTRAGPRQKLYECIDGVHYHRCRFEFGDDIVNFAERMGEGLMHRVREAEAFYGERFDVIHGHDWLAATGVVDARRGLHRPSVLTMHSTEYGRCGNTLPDGLSRRIRDREWEGIEAADRVICVSHALREELNWLYRTPLEKTEMIYNGVRCERFNESHGGEAVRASAGVAPDEPLVLFVGRLAWQKGPDLLLSAAPDLLHSYPEAKIVFVGDGDMRSCLEGQAASAGLFDSVRFLGKRANNDLVGLFQSADVVCVPSRNEPFGIVVLEAWSAARPVVVSRSGGPAEFVRDQETGFMVSPDRESLGWGLGLALSDRKRSDRVAKAGRTEAETRFSWDIIAQQTVKVYESAVN